ncbi:hypothetical protein F8154_11310 [Alkaliphilus pronyensis]|uniref:DUF4829 domain-containing protein n=1 Tax=Alkaliphilus pronyensis TaxID=1482732 RepID=A0A6I0EZS7_9FIRM|nr:hypothetical protein [Alkaliphilus pronyensis]KAB3532869.1 hypothetical protein F8154_11310 [Alkaliphilus pronyensis]
MKKLVVLVLLIGLFLAHHHNIFAALNEHDKSQYEDELKDKFQEIFYKRTKLFNELLVNEDISIAYIEGELERLEVDPLLTEDIKVFRALKENPSCHELIEGFNIEEFKIVALKNNVIHLDVKLLWRLAGLADISTEELSYQVKMVKAKDEWLLMDYEAVE